MSGLNYHDSNSPVTGGSSEEPMGPEAIDFFVAWSATIIFAEATRRFGMRPVRDADELRRLAARNS